MPTQPGLWSPIQRCVQLPWPGSQQKLGMCQSLMLSLPISRDYLENTPYGLLDSDAQRFSDFTECEKYSATAKYVTRLSTHTAAFTASYTSFIPRGVVLESRE